MSKQRAVGIDLGTTYSAMAWIDESGHSALITNAEGEMLTPSVVLFEDERVLVGKEAKRLGLYDAERMVECAKREMGSPLFSRPIMGRQLPPEVIQAFVLKRMKLDMVRIVGEDARAVITVPAFFDDPRRKATMDAAQMAGLQVLDIVNEPTAAALAFGEELGFLKESGGTKQKMFVLVYDLGGGTFDATLIEMQSGNLRTIATDGDVRLGGRDWDSALVDYASNEFKNQYQRDPREEHISHVRLLAAAEEAKHTLTVRNSATLRVSHAGETLDVKVTRELFEEETAHLLERTAYVTRQLLTAAGLTWPDLSRILLVGGSTRMPMVERMLNERTGVPPDRSVNPDEAVARGAALFADYILASHADSRRKPSFVVTNVNSHSLGIEGVDQQTGRKRNNIIIPRNSQLPAKKTEKFVTKSENQRSVVVKVLEGESPEPSECTRIGRTAIRDLPVGLAGGTPIHVTYEYASNGRLYVRAKVHGTDKEVALELEREGALSNAMVMQWGRLLESGCGLASFDSFLKTGTVPARANSQVPTAAAMGGEGQKAARTAAPAARAATPAPAAPQPVPRAAPVAAPAMAQPAAVPVARAAAVPQPAVPSNHQPMAAPQPIPRATPMAAPVPVSAPVPAPPAAPQTMPTPVAAPVSSGLSGGKLVLALAGALMIGMLLVGVGIGLAWYFLKQ